MQTLFFSLRSLLLSLIVFSGSAQAQSYQEQLKQLQFQNGPTVGKIADEATITVPKGYVFLDSANSRRFLEINGNPPRDGRFIFGPDSLDWFVVFSFNASGYVKDDEKIDADALLQTLKDSDEAGNKERTKINATPIYTVGWAVPPHYDLDTKRLEWGVRLRSEGSDPFVNYSIRLLGREGVMNLTLVANLDTLTNDVRQLKTLLKDFSYLPGKKYTEFKQGDKIAQYGLAALVLGGAAAVATKKGVWAAIAAFFAASWKLILAGAVALVAGLGSLFKRKKSP
jgi:uncharacterized membrane-anchored protein